MGSAASVGEGAEAGEGGPQSEGCDEPMVHGFTESSAALVSMNAVICGA